MKKTWEEITIGEYQEICSVDADSEVEKKVQIISILTDMDSDDIRRTNLKELFSMIEDAKFISTSPNADMNYKFELDGKKYGLINDFNYISAGEWLDAENWKNDTIGNMHLYAAMLYRPILSEDGDSYKIENHQPDGFIRRAELFKDKLGINKVHGAQVFFSLFVLESMSNLAVSLTGTKTQKKRTIKRKATRQALKKNKGKHS